MVAQQMKVTGVVINEDDGEPVIGASIVVKEPLLEPLPI